MFKKVKFILLKIRFSENPGFIQAPSVFSVLSRVGSLLMLQTVRGPWWSSVFWFSMLLHTSSQLWAAGTNKMNEDTLRAVMTFDLGDCLQGLNSPVCPLEVADSLSAQQVVSGLTIIR